MDGLGSLEWVYILHPHNTHLSRVAEVFRFVLFVHGDDPSDVFVLDQLEKQNKTRVKIKIKMKDAVLETSETII